MPGAVQISGMNLVTVLTADRPDVAADLVRDPYPDWASRCARDAENAMAARLMGININTVIVVAFRARLRRWPGSPALLWGARVGRMEYR